MQKYLALFQINVAQYFVYRLNFVLWRFRMVLNLTLTYFLWNSIYIGKTQVFNYTQSQMLSYILIMSLISGFVFSGRIQDLAGEILNGDIINNLLKPVPIFNMLVTKELGDKALNIGFAIVEIILFILLVKPPLYIPTEILTWIMFFISIIIGTIITFLISFIISMVAFWSAEVWAPRFIYFVLIFMLAGTTFPLDILPQPLYYTLLLTPFPYLIFLPTKIYLVGFTSQVMFPFVISVVWIGILYVMAKMFWQKGMKDYSFYGR